MEKIHFPERNGGFGMNCTYCGKEINDQWMFCMHCGTKVQPAAVETPVYQAPMWPDNMFETSLAPEMELPQETAPVMDYSFMDASQGRRMTIDPEKFEFYPEQRDEPVSKGVSSWELVPADTMTPKIQLPTKRGLGKMIFLGLITLGIYPVAIYSRIITELNIVASRYDGKRTMSFFGMMMLAPVTLSIYTFVWFHELCARIGDELQRRGISYKFGPSQFWLWNILGSFILVGPFVFLHKLMKSMNLLNKDFNEKG